MNLANELRPNVDPAEADTKHVQHVLNKHEAGRLVTVLACNECIDGAWWDVLVRNMEGNLQRVDVASEPGYDAVEVMTELS